MCALRARPREWRKANNQFWNFFSIEESHGPSNRFLPKTRWVVRMGAEEEDVTYCYQWIELPDRAAPMKATNPYLFFRLNHLSSASGSQRTLWKSRSANECEQKNNTSRERRKKKHFMPNLISVFYCFFFPSLLSPKKNQLEMKKKNCSFLIKVLRHYTI